MGSTSGRLVEVAAIQARWWGTWVVVCQGVKQSPPRGGFCQRHGWEMPVGCGLGPVFLGPDLLSSFVVAVVTVQRSPVPSLVSPCACPQSFATEGLPSHLASLCGLWHGKQAVAPFLLVFLQKIWRRRTVSGTVPRQGIPSTNMQVYLSWCCAGGETCM